MQDPDRCGILPFVFDDDFGFARYAEYALDVPMYFVNRCNSKAMPRVQVLMQLRLTTWGLRGMQNTRWTCPCTLSAGTVHFKWIQILPRSR